MGRRANSVPHWIVISLGVALSATACSSGKSATNDNDTPSPSNTSSSSTANSMSGRLPQGHDAGTAPNLSDGGLGDSTTDGMAPADPKSAGCGKSGAETGFIANQSLDVNGNSRAYDI